MEIQTVAANEFATSVDLELALPILKDCLNRLGRVEKVDAAKMIGSVRYGLQRVSMRISWVPDGATTRFVLQASSDDVWGVAARSAVTRFIELVRNHNNPGYKISRTGMNPFTLVGVVSAFVIVMIAVFCALSKFL